MLTPTSISQDLRLFGSLMSSDWSGQITMNTKIDTEIAVQISINPSRTVPNTSQLGLHTCLWHGGVF